MRRAQRVVCSLLIVGGRRIGWGTVEKVYEGEEEGGGRRGRKKGNEVVVVE
jgi:hypothetical protein